jgi:bacterioferritin
MADKNYDKPAVVRLLNKILEMELAGVVRYTHYSLMVFGLQPHPDRGSWLRAASARSRWATRTKAGELRHAPRRAPVARVSARLLETRAATRSARSCAKSLAHERATLQAVSRAVARGRRGHGR